MGAASAFLAVDSLAALEAGAPEIVVQENSARPEMGRRTIRLRCSTIDTAGEKAGAVKDNPGSLKSGV